MDVSGQLDRWTTHIGQSLDYLETEVHRWQTYKEDNDALANQLKTLPDTTSKTAMARKLAFMPGRLIHTNEILVLLGDQYYAERSAKQALAIVERRNELVNENLHLIEAQLNAAKAKSGATNVFQQGSDVNEEGLPIMEIREELPAPSAATEKKVMKKEKSPEKLPSSVQRARDMMVSKPNDTEENDELFDLLRKLEEEEEEELAEAENDYNEEKEDEDEDEDEDAEFDAFYDTEVTDTMFDHFEDDEEYAADGVVEQEDATYYENSEEKDTVTTTDTPGLPDVIEHHENLDVKEDKEEPVVKIKTPDRPESKPKKVSRFKLARQEERSSKDSPYTSTKKTDAISAVTAEQTSSSRSEQQQEENLKKGSKNVVPTILNSKTIVAAAEVNIDKIPTSEKKVSSKVKPGQHREKPPVRKVTWDDTTTVREHERLSAPTTTAGPLYSEPIKNEAESIPQRAIQTPADIFSFIRETQEAEIEYPSFDDTADSTPVDIHELVSAVKSTSEAFWRPVDGSDDNTIQLIQEMRSAEPTPQAPSSVKSRMDTNIMKGKVMERETETLDLDQVEDDMDMREIAATYYSKRQNLAASMEGYKYDPKPEFEVIDEELPLPKNRKGKQKEEEFEEEQPQQPRKMSRFKAARLGLSSSNG
ncbi:uri1, prefoldin-like chaperone [Apophysomyces sp. BC1034]|nr:uri1, prefoldin-like chaperone [Apophysomyces sp. BC1034]